MKKALKEFWRRIVHFWYPAIMLMWAADSYVIGSQDKKWLSYILSFALALCALCMFYDESEKLRKEEERGEKE